MYLLISSAWQTTVGKIRACTRAYVGVVVGVAFPKPFQPPPPPTLSHSVPPLPIWPRPPFATVSPTRPTRRSLSQQQRDNNGMPNAQTHTYTRSSIRKIMIMNTMIVSTGHRTPSHGVRVGVCVCVCAVNKTRVDTATANSLMFGNHLNTFHLTPRASID